MIAQMRGSVGSVYTHTLCLHYVHILGRTSLRVCEGLSTQMLIYSKLENAYGMHFWLVIAILFDTGQTTGAEAGKVTKCAAWSRLALFSLVRDLGQS